MRKSWQVQPGKGEAILDFMGDAARRWSNVQVSEAYLEQQARCFTQAGESVLDRLVQATFNDSARRIVYTGEEIDKLSPIDCRNLLSEVVSGCLADEVQARKKSIDLLNDTDLTDGKERVRLRALESGLVTHSDLVVEGLRGRHYYKPRLLSAGEVIEASYIRFYSSPAQGGELSILSALSSTTMSFVTGLVSPQTGEPQVELKILAKS